MSQSQMLVTISLLFTALFIVYHAMFTIPEMDPTFFYESMQSHIIYSKGSLGHPFYETRKSVSHDNNAPKKYFKRHVEEKMVLFVIPGNFGGYIQIPPILNTLDNYTDFLNENQERYHYRTYSYGFEFEHQPSAFSQNVVREQAQYVAKSISEIMQTYEPGTKFSFITHSMGTIVAYLATQSKKFPLDQLANIFSLSGPLEEAPQLFNSEISNYIHKITANFSSHLRENVVHINFHGGARDQLVDQNLANYRRFTMGQGSLKYSLSVKSSQLKNVYSPMDHNSLLYYKFFWDQAAPVIAKVALKSFMKVEERFQLALDTLQVNIDPISLEKASLWNDTLEIHSLVELENVNSTVKHLIDSDIKKAGNYSTEIQISEFDILASQTSGSLLINIQTNLDKTHKVRLFIKAQTNETIEIEVENNPQRIYHKSNLLFLTISIKDIKQIMDGRALKFQQLILTILKQSSTDVSFNIMNYSPCKDKKNPILWKPDPEEFTYLQMSLEDTQYVHTFEEYKLLYKRRAIKLSDQSNPKVIIKSQALTEATVPLLGTAIPMKVCIQYSENTLVNNIVVIKSSQEEYPEFYFVNSMNPCFQTYPLRRISVDNHQLEIEIKGDKSQLKNAQLILQPSYVQLFRESATHHKWYAMSISFAVSLLIHFIQTRDNNFSPQRLFWNQTSWVLLLIGSIHLTSAGFSKFLHQISQKLDYQGDTSYYVMNSQVSSKLSLIDVFIVTIISYLLVFLLLFAFDLLILISNLVFKNGLLKGRKLINNILHLLIIVGASFCAYASVVYNLYFGILAMYVLVLLDFSIRLNNYRGEATLMNIQYILFPIALYLVLFIDKYLVEVWRFKDNFRYFHYTYSENQLQCHIPVITMLMTLLLLDLKTINNSYQNARYCILVISFYGIFMVGQFIYRMRLPLFAAFFIIPAIMILSAIGNKLSSKSSDKVKEE